MLFSHLCLDIASGTFLSGFLKTMCFSSSAINN
jgi:hypothetical protein